MADAELTESREQRTGETVWPVGGCERCSSIDGEAVAAAGCSRTVTRPFALPVDGVAAFVFDKKSPTTCENQPKFASPNVQAAV